MQYCLRFFCLSLQGNGNVQLVNEVFESYRNYPLQFEGGHKVSVCFGKSYMADCTVGKWENCVKDAVKLQPMRSMDTLAGTNR